MKKYAIKIWKAIFFLPAIIFLFLYSVCVAIAYLDIEIGIYAFEQGR